jgi:hypothetical protein
MFNSDAKSVFFKKYILHLFIYEIRVLNFMALQDA